MNNSNLVYRNRINKVVDYIDTHLYQPLSLDALAAVACYSPFHFHRVFVALTGETINNYVNRFRNEKAARLLRFSNKAVSVIAAECGFSSPATLSRSFNQYFGLSPSAYKNGEEIKNSKISKELFPTGQYHCTEDNEALEKKFPVKIRQLPERHIAYIRVTNAFKEGVVIAAFEKLIAWAQANDVYQSGTIFGMSVDDPDVTPKEKYRYEACITIPKGLKVASGQLIETAVLPACKYAVTAINGDMHLVGQAFSYLFDNWLINSEYECEHLPGMEIFLNKENVCNWESFDLELLIPIKKLTTS